MAKLSLALLILALTGCTTPTGVERGAAHETSAAIDESVDLSQPMRGFQVETTGAWVEPGDDVRTCEVVALPGTERDLYYVNRIESALSAYGEDLVVSAALPDTETSAIMDVGASVPCTRAGEAFGEELSRVIATQEGYRDERFPEGVGKIFHGGQKLAIESHFVNESSEATPAKVKLSFHTVDASAVQRIARTASFSNFTIYTPPNGKSSHLGQCAVDEDMLVGQLTRRTQRYGTTFNVWHVGGEHDGELVWQSDHRGLPGKELGATPLAIAAGEGLRFQCDFQNTSDRELRYGISASDETCMLDATFWTPTDADDQSDKSCLLFSVDADGIARK